MDEAIADFSSKGFNASCYDRDWPRSDEDCKSIWLGSDVPASIAISALKIAYDCFPYLCYVQLSSDDGNKDIPKSTYTEVLVGGSTARAEELGLKAWSAKDFAQLDEGMSLVAFHAFVRSKY
ncbi:MAG: hypothetical protein GY810_10420 [Aureispira sp.]|nr:hypothetical protein [Aureispira sp.]